MEDPALQVDDTGYDFASMVDGDCLLDDVGRPRILCALLHAVLAHQYMSITELCPLLQELVQSRSVRCDQQLLFLCHIAAPFFQLLGSQADAVRLTQLLCALLRQLQRPYSSSLKVKDTRMNYEAPQAHILAPFFF